MKNENINQKIIFEHKSMKFCSMPLFFEKLPKLCSLQNQKIQISIETIQIAVL